MEHVNSATLYLPGILLRWFVELAGLNDTLGAEVVITHHITVDPVMTDGRSASPGPEQARRLNSPPAVLFGNGIKVPQPAFSPVSVPLPSNVELTTWQLEVGGTVLLRLTHIYPLGTHPILASMVSVNLCTTLPAFVCLHKASIVELVAGANAELGDVERLVWRTRDTIVAAVRDVPQSSPDLQSIDLAPGDIRTFRLSF